MIVQKQLKEISSAFEPYKNIEIAECNDSCLRMSINHGVYDWHKHDNSDELFLVIEGQLFIDVNVSDSYCLNPFEYLIIPKGIVHRTRSNQRTVNLTFEKADLRTEFVTPENQYPTLEFRLEVKNVIQITALMIDKGKDIALNSVNDHVIRINAESYGNRVHANSDELFLGIKGQMDVISDSQCYSLLPGDILRVPKGIRHSIVANKRMVCISFSHENSETSFS